MTRDSSGHLAYHIPAADEGPESVADITERPVWKSEAHEQVRLSA